jgi:probable HAF family extracellular repeat protein
MKLRPLMLATITLLAALPTSTQLAAQQQNELPSNYEVTDLGTLGGIFGTANAVNNSGSVVGFANLPGDTESHAFFWSRGIKRDLRGARS